MSIKGQLDAGGHARVLVVLKPQKTRRVDGRSSLALDETISLQQEAAQSLKRCFKHFKNSRTAAMQRELSISRMAAFAATGGEGDAPAEPAYEMDEAAAVVPPTDAVRYYPNLGVMFGTVDAKGLADLEDATAEVSAVIEPPELSLIQPEEDAALAGPPAGHAWTLTRMKVPALWDRGVTGDGVLIGHLDTGADVGHPALADVVDAFAEFDLTGRRLANSVKRDTGIHGTHTAGIIAGKPFNGSIFGVAPGAKLASAVVIERGDTAARVFGGLDWCISQGVRVINVSLGVRRIEPQFSTILRIVRQRGVLPVVAIGNEGPQTSRSPGNLAESLSVGAIDEIDQIWINSSSQQMPETPKRFVPIMVAPGAGVFSCVPNQRLQSMSGTSMAAPHVAGLAALLFGHKPDATVEEVEKAILASCTRPDGISTLRGGKGVPDAVEALAKL